MLPLAAGESRRVKLRVVYGYWGGAGAVSHSQLSLIGYSNRHWKWDESAMGCWGESMTYNPDKNTGGAFMCDVRPTFTTSYKTNPEYGWTENVGGGDFLVYYDSAKYPSPGETPQDLLSLDRPEYDGGALYRSDRRRQDPVYIQEPCGGDARLSSPFPRV